MLTTHYSLLLPISYNPAKKNVYKSIYTSIDLIHKHSTSLRRAGRCICRQIMFSIRRSPRSDPDIQSIRPQRNSSTAQSSTKSKLTTTVQHTGGNEVDGCRGWEWVEPAGATTTPHPICSEDLYDSHSMTRTTVRSIALGTPAVRLLRSNNSTTTWGRGMGSGSSRMWQNCRRSFKAELLPCVIYSGMRSCCAGWSPRKPDL
jgi:hypothetical protein